MIYFQIEKLEMFFDPLNPPKGDSSSPPTGGRLGGVIYFQIET